MTFRLPNFNDMYTDMVKGQPKLERGRVWCRTCGATLKVAAADCLRRGWPKCCGYTMTLDSPDERKELTNDNE